ncbi:phospholipase D-like domain-containing protein [Halorubrum vacuolatum]|uniref:Phosphatidylserine/phosphatidylglycerophosphate/cardiolipin synthase n=1 Tax=Halorubrum vacuolatum TaxID=63740 RepID=A0A238VT25_HALVU|nr:Phosphatidylserine/phosphatidylglycerophosphate/cardiolipin synthase [Halorubrum vacuolatum]
MDGSGVATPSGIERITAGGSTGSVEALIEADDASRPANASPAIVELYPNPVTERNRGEYLIVRLPGPGNWSLSDGYHRATVPEEANGTVALSMHPSKASDHVDEEVPIRPLSDHFPLAADGDRIVLKEDGEPVDVVEYGRIREGYRWRVDWAEWRPDGYEPRDPVAFSDAELTPFVLPDSPERSIRPIETASERVLVAGYTLSSERVVEALIEAADRGVTVRVLIEGTPVGGFSERGATAADRLDAAGVEVRVLDGEPDRFRFHHAKYAVADDEAIVLTENWEESGTDGRSNRGWGVTVTEPRVADELAALFAHDAAAHDAQPWEAFRANTTFHESGVANGTYPTRFDPPNPSAADVTLLTAPGNADDELVARIDAAEDRALAIVPRTGGADERIVAALRRAAERGVETHLLLSGAWYDERENRELADELAEEPIEVAIADPRGRFDTVHAKGVVVDETVVVGSLNYNEVARTENREVLLAIDDPEVADFYARVFAADWRGGGVQLPIGFLGGAVAALIIAGGVARREVEFT